MATEENIIDFDEDLTRFHQYCILGWTEQAKNDPWSRIRLNAYRILGFTEKAFDDIDWMIRIEAYYALGFTRKALDDEDVDIREEAEAFFKLLDNHTKEELKERYEIWQLKRM